MCHCGKPLHHVGRHLNPPNPTHPLCPRCGGTTRKTGRRKLSDGWRAQEYRCRQCGHECVREMMRRVHRLADYERDLRRLLVTEGRSNKEAMYELGLSSWCFYQMLRQMRAQRRAA